MNKYIIGWGIAMAVKCKNEDEANKEAWQMACEEYDSYAGLHGLRDIDQIMEEEQCDGVEAQDIYDEERESWLDYKVLEYTPENVEAVSIYHFEDFDDE